MARLTPVSWPDLVKRLKQLGLKGPYYGTKHPYMMKGNKTVIHPNPHHGEDISADFLETSESAAKNGFRGSLQNVRYF